jgi:hypothetical protein
MAFTIALSRFVEPITTKRIQLVTHKLEAAAGDKFVRGLVFHDHDSLRPVSEKISGVPVSVLWPT